MSFTNLVPQYVHQTMKKEKDIKRIEKTIQKIVPKEDEEEAEEVPTAYVYIIKDRNSGAFNIGYHQTPEIKLKELKKGNMRLTMVETIKIIERPDSEHLAHDGVLRHMKPRLTKGNRGRNWFENPDEATDTLVINSVKSALSKVIVFN